MAKYNTGLHTNSHNGNILHEYPCGHRIPFVNIFHIQVDYNHGFYVKTTMYHIGEGGGGVFFLHDHYKYVKNSPYHHTLGSHYQRIIKYGNVEI